MNWKLARLRKRWIELDQLVDFEDPARLPESKTASNEKIYATISSLEGDSFVALGDEGVQYTVKIGNHNGKGSRSDAKPGTRVKLYMRNGEDFFRYRFIGG